VFEAALFIVGAAVAWVLVLGMRRWARRLRLLDMPNQRSMHTRATPRGGGAAIVAVSLVGIAVGAVFGAEPESLVFGGYLAGALLIVGVSLADDVLKLPSGIRLAVHLLGAALMVAGLGLVSHLIPAAQAGLAWLLLAAAILWTAGLTNAYNFMDGIDGLAAIQAIVAGLGWTLLGFMSHQPRLEVLGLLIAASSTGFLVHNWPPAKIFMGDVGSAFLGFTFAFMALAELRRTPQVALVGALLLWPFIFDTVFTMARRFLRGENIFLAHRSHLYQRLVLAGWSQASVTSLYGLFALVMVALGALWLVVDSATIGYFLIAVVCLLPLGLWIVVIRAERQVAGPRDARPLMGRGR
jgi:UDP-N-acetylmuramyl pentapeptide phosphotransferase/UDP-N-acetylglucosamine-1-phosphate transferase